MLSSYEDSGEVITVTRRATNDPVLQDIKCTVDVQYGMVTCYGNTVRSP